MKKILLLVMVCCAVVAAQAQRVYFMYLQTDNKTPFYLKTGDKVYSSSAQGYLIVPRLVDSTYNVVIGKSGFSEARFTIPINGKDRGFALREGSQKLSLFDLQSLQLIEASVAAQAPVSYIQKTDRFTTLLAQAADDTSLLQMVVFAKNEKPQTGVNAQEAVTKSTPPAAEISKDIIEQTAPPVTDTQATALQVQNKESTQDTATTIAAVAKETPQKQQEEVAANTETAAEQKQQQEPVQVVTPAPAAEESVYKRSVVTRRAESSTSEGFGLVFTDNVDGIIDTIRIVIPNPKVAYNTVAEETENKPVTEPRFLEVEGNAATVKEEKEVKDQKKRKGLFGFKKETNEEVVAADKAEAPAKKTEAVKADEGCRSQASANDFARLRRSLVSKNSEDDMVAEGAKAFKNKCYTTEQVKALSSLLLTSNGRYRLFEAAYPHVSDRQNFHNLQNDLWDRSDIERFKALIGR